MLVLVLTILFFCHARFAHVVRAETLWTTHASLAWWLACVFFATLGFSIPAADLVDAEGFGLGVY